MAKPFVLTHQSARCTICNHPDLPEIDRGVIDGRALPHPRRQAWPQCFGSLPPYQAYPSSNGPPAPPGRTDPDHPAPGQIGTPGDPPGPSLSQVRRFPFPQRLPGRSPGSFPHPGAPGENPSLPQRRPLMRLSAPNDAAVRGVDPGKLLGRSGPLPANRLGFFRLRSAPGPAP